MEPDHGRIVLARDEQCAVVSSSGGRLDGYQVAGKEVVVGDEPGGRAVFRNSLLAPWPNRVTDGRWSWQGVPLSLPVNEPDPGTAIHGLVAYAPFEVVHEDEQSASFAHDLEPVPGYPFPLRVESSYRLEDDGLACSLRAVNTGDGPAPVGLAVHPYLDCRGPVDDVELTLPASSYVVLSPTWEDLGHEPVDGTDWDFRTPRRVGPVAIDACWTDVVPEPDGRVVMTARFPDGEAVSVWGGDTTRWLVVYNGDTLPGAAHRRSIALEPCTAPANALRSGHDLTVLAPDESLELTWGIATSW